MVAVEPRGNGLRRERTRVQSLPVDKQDIANRVIDFFNEDDNNRAAQRDLRLQRYAKFRGWTEGSDGFPWEDSSDIAYPDITTDVLRTEDTLHNAVMSARPPVVSVATRKDNENKLRVIDTLIDTQFFIEGDGENVVARQARNFVIDGHQVTFTPWINEEREVTSVKTFEGIPPEVVAQEHFIRLLQQIYDKEVFQQVDEEGWDWRVFIGDREVSVRFYTDKDDMVEMVTCEMAVVYDGPKNIVKDWEDILAPVRAANLQIPSPSNPEGASHVILVDRPTVDELRRLVRRGTYDQVTLDDLDALEAESRDRVREAEQEQKDTIQGAQDIRESKRESTQKRFTRFMCFDTFDIDGDGVDEDVIWWVLKERKLLLKAKLLTEMYPTADRPYRPLSESQFIPVSGRREGIGLVELLEPMHDFLKSTFDQAVDAGTISNFPFGFYRPSSNLKPELMRLSPLDLVPLSDPQNDIHFPQLNSTNSQTFSLNMISMGQTLEERLSSIGDLQLGRVPAGKATALRTVSGIQTILSQGEARPERILRRFFMGLTQMWRNMHRLNRFFLKDGKKYRIAGFLNPQEDPYIHIENASEIDVDLEFDFRANVLNTSKEALNTSLEAIMGLYLNPLVLQLGLIDAEGVYKLLRAAGSALGQDPDQYLIEPSPAARQMKITAEIALAQINEGNVPEGLPAEGAQVHLQKVQAFAESDKVQIMSVSSQAILQGYIQQLSQAAAEEQRLQQLQQAAAQFQQQLGQGGPSGGPQSPNEPTQLGPGELQDETLPGARGEVG